MFAENFNSPMVRWHYSSARAQASSFLLTIGAKALVITEDRDTLEDVKLSGIVEEAHVRKQLVSQERIRSIRRNLIEKVPLVVYKRARNNTIRPIQITIVCLNKKQTYLEWRSKLNYLKKFEVDENTHINCKVDETAGRGQEEGLVNHTTPSTLPEDKFSVRFTNRRRFLDLQFNLRVEGEAFILVLQHYVPNIDIAL
ncbi:hypothetical protein EON65_42730 [archaeon]|nr:MAG: hypothetical protein EON65_42730 [archaeon]